MGEIIMEVAVYLPVWKKEPDTKWACSNCGFRPEPQNVRTLLCPDCGKQMQNPEGVR
jgi:transposase